MKSILLAGAVTALLSTSLTASTGGISIGAGSKTFNYDQGGEVDTSNVGVTAYYIFPSQSPLKVLVGGGLNRTSISSEGSTSQILDLQASSILKYDRSDISPYAKMDVILSSSGEVGDDDFGDVDLENDGYELAIGADLKITPAVSISLETAMLASKQLKADTDLFEVSADYKYGPFEAFQAGLNVTF